MSRDADKLALLIELSGDAAALVSRLGDSDALGADRLMQHAATSLVTQVGEAARGLSDDCRARHPEVPWSRIIAARNVVVHGYATIDWRIVWRILTHDIPELATQARAMLASDFPADATE